MKISIILSALTVLALSSATAFASEVKIPESNAVIIVKTPTTEQGSQEAEVVFYEEIETYYEVNFEANLDEIVSPIHHVVVYDAQGNTVAQFESASYQEIPTGAEMLMTDGDTAYYIVLN